MVKDEIWAKARMDDLGFLCIACLEKRLGRELGMDDFNWDLPVNITGQLDSPRLIQRKCSDTFAFVKNAKEMVESSNAVAPVAVGLDRRE
jgi:hypothetical protein